MVVTETDAVPEFPEFCVAASYGVVALVPAIPTHAPS